MVITASEARGMSPPESRWRGRESWAASVQEEEQGKGRPLPLSKVTKRKQNSARALELHLGQGSPTWQKGQLPAEGPAEGWEASLTSQVGQSSSFSSLGGTGESPGGTVPGRSLLPFKAGPRYQSKSLAKPRSRGQNCSRLQCEGPQSRRTKHGAQGRVRSWAVMSPISRAGTGVEERWSDTPWGTASAETADLEAVGNYLSKFKNAYVTKSLSSKYIYKNTKRCGKACSLQDGL